MAKKAEPPIRILTLDGGGLRGVYTLQILSRLEQDLGKRIHQAFDMIAGTSTGGLIALQLGLGHEKVDSVMRTYVQLGSEVFQWTYPRSVGLLKGHGLYDTSSLERNLKQSLPQGRLNDHEPSTTRSTPHVFTVAALCNVSPGRPYLLSNYARDPQSPFEGTCWIDIWQAARATSAAPTYFEPFSVSDQLNRGQKLQLLDGGIVANNPALVAYLEARKLWPDRDIVLVSLGTGSPPSVTKKLDGLVELITETLNAAMCTDIVERTLQSMLPSGSCYFRFNGAVRDPDMHLVKHIDSWQQNAREDVKKWVAGPEWAKMLSMLSRDVKP